MDCSLLVLLHTNYPISDVLMNYSVQAMKEWHEKAHAESRNMFRALGPETWEFSVLWPCVGKTVLKAKATRFKAVFFPGLEDFRWIYTF